MSFPIENLKRAAANLYEAAVFAAECGETVEEWLQNPDVKDDPEWQEALALHRELEHTTNAQG